MSINILDLVKSQIGGQIAGQIAGKFGVNEQMAKSGIDALLPIILGGLVSKVSSPGGTEALGKTLDEGGFDGGALDNLSGMFSGSGADDLAKKGGGIVSMIFGDKAAALGPIIAKLTGMKSDSIMSMLTMLAPLVMGFLGKTKNASGMDAKGLASMLMSQKDSIAAAMPAGVSDAMGLGLLSPTKPAASPARTQHAPASGGGSAAKVLVPLVILAAVGFGCYQYIFGGMRPSGPAGNIVIPADPNAPVGQSSEAPAPAERAAMAPAQPEAEVTAEPPKEPVATTPAPAAETTEPVAEMPAFDITKMPGMFEKLSGTFEKVKDVDSAKAALPDLETVDKQLDAASAAFAAIPELIRGPIAKTLQGSFPAVEEMINKAMAIPGVSEILKPIVDSMMSKIKPLIGAAA